MTYGDAGEEGRSREVTRAVIAVAPADSARRRRNESRTSRRSMAMYSLGLRVLPKSTVRLGGEMIFMRVTLRSTSSGGMENSSSMQRGMAPPQGLEEAGLRSKRKVSMPPAARVSAAEDPAGPPPMTAARSLRPERGGLDIEEMMREEGLEVEKGFVLMEKGSEEEKREDR